MTTCKIKSANSLYDSVCLQHNNPLVIGRGPLTKIKDKRLSRNHVKLTADFQTGLLNVELIGANKCKAGDEILSRNDSVQLKHGDVLELLEKQYSYTVEFDPVPNYPSCARKENLEMVGKQTTLFDFLGKRKSENPAEGQNESKKVKMEHTWEEIDGGKLMVFCTEGVQSKSKIAAFDMDGTIITPKSGKVFPTDFNDWKILLSQIPAKLKQLIQDDYKVVFMTNQGGMAKGTTKPSEFREKLVNIASKLSIPLQVFISPKQSIYRKPSTGMWKYLVDQANDGIAVDMSSSFYCGDAAGRQAKWALGKKKDHSCGDRLFAMNLGLKFYTPEEYFLGQRPVAYKEPSFNPRAFEVSGPLLHPSNADLTSVKQEVIMLVGYPGSGKSHFSKQHSAKSKYVVVNRDLLGSWQKCTAEMEKALDVGKSVIIDNTNPDCESRSRFLKIAAARRIPCRCFMMNSSLSHAQHNNKFRELTDEKHAPISRMIFNIYKSKYKEPVLDEGFTEMVRVNFRYDFTSPDTEALYKMYLLED